MISDQRNMIQELNSLIICDLVLPLALALALALVLAL